MAACRGVDSLLVHFSLSPPPRRWKALSCSSERASERPSGASPAMERLRLLLGLELGVGVLCFTGLLVSLQRTANCTSLTRASLGVICEERTLGLSFASPF